MDPFRRRLESDELVIDLRLAPQPHRPAHQPALGGDAVVLDQQFDSRAAGGRPGRVVWHLPMQASGNRRAPLFRIAQRVSGPGARLTPSSMTTTRRWRTALADTAALLAVVWVIPVGILLVGAPVALALALLLWVGRLLRGAF